MPSRARTFLTKIGNVKLPRGYDEQTYASPYWIVRYPHRKRIQIALDAIRAAHPKALLDYGAGDGRLLLDALDAGLDVDRIVAYEPVAEMRAELSKNLGEHPAGHRITVCSERSKLQGPFDYVLCLEVLEHMPLSERESFYRLCNSTLGEQGQVLIDVPVEIGPTLFVKALGRRVLKGRKPEYSWSALFRHSLGAPMFDPSRYDPAYPGTWIHDHKGFDYRLFREELASRLTLVSSRPSPVRRLPAPLFNHAMFFVAARSSRPTLVQDAL